MGINKHNLAASIHKSKKTKEALSKHHARITLDGRDYREKPSITRHIVVCERLTGPTKQSTVEEKIKKNFAGLTNAEKLCIVELYREFDRITQI